MDSSSDVALTSPTDETVTPTEAKDDDAAQNGVKAAAGSNQVYLGFEHLMVPGTDGGSSPPGDAVDFYDRRPSHEAKYHVRRPSDMQDGSYVTTSDADLTWKQRVVRSVMPCIPIWVEVIGLITYLADVGSDVSLAVYYVKNDHIYWGALTIAFVTISCMVTVCQWPHLLTKFYQDSSNFRIFIIYVLFIPLCIIVGPILTTYMALKLLRHHVGVYRYGTRGWKQEKIEADVASKSRLRLYECIMESTPQLCLQLYIYNKQPPADDDDDFKLLLQWVSIGTSLWSISIAGPMYDRVTHSTKKQLPWGLTVIHVLSTMCTVAARILTLALSLVIGPIHVLPIVLPHMLFLTVWHCLFKIQPRTPDQWLSSAEWWFSLLTGVYMHSDIKYEFYDNDLGYRVNFWVHYIISTLVNAIMITYWFEWHGPDVLTSIYILLAVRLLGIVGIPLGAGTMWYHLELSAQQKARLKAEKKRRELEEQRSRINDQSEIEC